MEPFYITLFEHTFLQNACIGGLLAALACGLVGPFVVVKRMAYIAGGISHSVLAGMGVAYFFGGQPLVGALVAALVAAIMIGQISLLAKQHEDTIISAVWTLGMAIGILFLAKAKGYNTDLMSYLFGNILLIDRSALIYIACLNVFILLMMTLFYKQFVAVCFDTEYTRSQGIAVNRYYLLLLSLVAFTTVILIQVVGLILVIALLTLPAAIARLFSQRLPVIIIGAVSLGSVLTLLGLITAYYADLPAGSTITLLTGLIFLLAIFIKSKPLKQLTRQS